MEDKKSLATLLGQFMGAAEIGDARLASLVNKQVNITGFLHRSTVRNWRNGSSKSVKDWRQLAAIAAALDLDQDNTDQLLFAGGCPPIHTLKKMANEEDHSFLMRWKTEEPAAPPPQIEQPIEPMSSDIIKATETADSLPAPKKSAVPHLLKIAVPAILVFGLFYGLSRWMGGGAIAEPFTIYSDQVETQWDFIDNSWDFTAEPLKTDLAVEGEQILNVTLEEYGGLNFSGTEPINTEPYSFLQLYVRRAESAQEGRMSLNILIDDDDDFDNGEVGRTVINNHVEEEISDEAWHEVKIPLNVFSPQPFPISQVVIHSPINGKTPHFWVDHIQLVSD